MIRLAATGAFLAGAVLACSAHAAPPAASQDGRVVAQTGRMTSGAAPAARPDDVSGLLAPLNRIRNRAEVGALVWSQPLAEQARELAAAAAADCTWSSTKEALGATTSIFYWAPEIRRIDGKALAQKLSPSFVVAEWRKGGADYNPATGVCRRAGLCATYSRIATPLSKSVGCAHVVCPTQAQVWVCRFDDT